VAGTWNVTFSERFMRQLLALGPEGYDWSAVLDNLRWHLERGPESIGHGTQDLHVRFVSVAPVGGPPIIKVFYSIEPGEVEVIFVKESDPFPF
jgi:hypothetical protein